MAHPQIAVFPRLGKENSPPARLLAGQQTRLARTMHDIRYDPVHDEILVTNPFALALLAFRGDANGEEAPLRVIQGPHTQLAGSSAESGLDRLDLDPVHNEIFVPNGDAVLVFSRTASGDTAPIRVLRGPDTRLRRTASLAVDPLHNLLVVLQGDSLLIFNRTDEGNVKPRAVIVPPANEHFRSSQIQIYPPQGWIFVATVSRQASYAWEMEFGGAGIGIWSINDNGQMRPRWKLTGPESRLKSSRAVAFNAKDKEVYVADMRQNAILTYYFPELF